MVRSVLAVTDQFPVYLCTIPLLTGGKTASVQIVIASLFGGAQIDSVMVDPYRRG